MSFKMELKKKKKELARQEAARRAKEWYKKTQAKKKKEQEEIFYDTEPGTPEDCNINSNNKNNSSIMSETQALKITIDNLVNERNKLSITIGILQDRLKQLEK